MRAWAVGELRRFFTYPCRSNRTDYILQSPSESLTSQLFCRPSEMRTGFRAVEFGDGWEARS